MKTKAYIYGVEKVNGYDAWSLFVASAAGDVKRVRELLGKDPLLVNSQFWYQFPIHMAVREGNLRTVKLLLDHGADPGQSRFTYNSWDKLLQIARTRGQDEIGQLLQQTMKDRFNYSPDFVALKDAIIARNARSIAAVLRHRPESVLASDELGNNAIHWCVMTRQLRLIDRFLDLGTPIDAPRADGNTPVLLAAHHAYDYWYRGARDRKHPSIRNAWVVLGHLLARGADYSISVAAAAGDSERVAQLLKRDPSLARRLDSARLSPLSYAAREGYGHIVQQLLDHGANPNSPEELAPQGRALFEACGGNHLEIAELLLEHGANPNAGVDSCGCCLYIVKYHHPQTCRPMQKLLRSHGAYTPPYEMSVREMKLAIRKRHEVLRDEEFVGCLLNKKDAALLDAFLKQDSNIPERMRVYAGITYPRSPAMIHMLLARGLDPNRPDWLGKSYLHACAENLDTTAAAIFLKAGGDINARDVEFKGTPLATAVRCGAPSRSLDTHQLEQRRTRMVKFLLKHGAATNLPGDPAWATPLAWARKRGLADIESLLIQHGARL